MIHTAFRCLVATSLFCACVPAFAQKVPTEDPLAEFLRSRGFANIPYIKQNQAKLGAVVADPNAPGLPIFEVPSKAVPAADPNPGILVPGEIVAKIQSAGLGLTLLGFDAGADFNAPETLSYNTINLTGPQLDIDQVRALLKDPSTVAKLDAYKGDLTRFKKNQTFTAALYVVSGVFYTTGVDIVAKSSTQISLKANATIPACASTPAAGSATPPDVKDTNKPNTPDATPPADTPKPARSDAPAEPKPDKPKNGTGTGTSPAASAAASAVKVAGDAVATAADAVTTAADKGVPGGRGQYCRGLNGEVHFSSTRPIPVAIEVYYASWNGKGYVAETPNRTPLFKAN